MNELPKEEYLVVMRVKADMNKYGTPDKWDWPTLLEVPVGDVQITGCVKAKPPAKRPSRARKAS